MNDAPRTLDGLTSLVSFAGFTVPARARFVGQFLGQTLYASLTVGLVAGQFGAAALSCGPLVPFLCGSWVGYTYGCVGFWKTAKAKALGCARTYPRVMAHGLSILPCPKQHTLPAEGSGTALEEWILAGGIGRISYAILAAQSCEEDILEMQRKRRQELIDEYASGQSSD